jgi:hypothetical protein
MVSIADSKRFVPGERLPTRPIWISGSQAYAAMSAAKVGAMIALDGDLPLYFISARFLRVAIETAAKDLGLRSATVVPLSQHLIEFWKPDSRLSPEVTSRFKKAGQAEDYAAVPIWQADSRLSPEDTKRFKEAGEAEDYDAVPISGRFLSVSPEIDLKGHEVFRVENSWGTSVGWYFSGEQALDIIQTPPDVWYCELYNHPNGDPDTGQCHTCGGKLKT